MNKKKLLALAPSCLIAMLSGSNVFADICPSDFYVGFDVLKTSFSTKEGYGRNVFAKNPTAFNAFVGYKLPRNFFVEAGYEWTGKNGRSVDLVDFANYPGAPSIVRAGQYFSNIRTKIKTQSPYALIGVIYQIPCFHKTTISGSVGLSSTKIKAQFNDLSGITPSRSFIKRKISPLLQARLNHSISSNLEIHFVATWHKLTNFKIKTLENPSGPMELRMKNGYAIGTGLIYYFK